jgi:NAD(P)-dependent dehydrogenase (short-subunit alcohol dehydrogenase family)
MANFLGTNLKVLESTMHNFADKVVFITGGTSGIGEDAAHAFAKLDAKVVFTGRRKDKGESIAAAIKAGGGEALFLQSDVSKESDVKNAIKKTVDTFGRIDIAVNNAGVEEQMIPFMDQKLEKFDEIFSINVRGLWICLHKEIEQMLKQNSECSIINISSVAGQTGFPQTATYSASKHAVNGLTRSLASEFAPHKIRINAVAPGPIKTEMWDRFAVALPAVEQMVTQMVPSGRVGTTEEVSSCILWLASKTASFVTGQVIVVDGGMVNV